MSQSRFGQRNHDLGARSLIVAMLSTVGFAINYVFDTDFVVNGPVFLWIVSTLAFWCLAFYGLGKVDPGPTSRQFGPTITSPARVRSTSGNVSFDNHPAESSFRSRSDALRHIERRLDSSNWRGQGL